MQNKQYAQKVFVKTSTSKANDILEAILMGWNYNRIDW